MKRIMRRFAINEISAVDKPAQEGARAVIMKRDENTGAAVAVHRQRNSGMDYSKVDRGALAMLALQGLAKALREREPHLSPEQAFSRVFADPANRIAAKAERDSSRARLIGGVPVARTSAQVLNDLGDDAIHALIDEIRRDNPVLDDAGIVRLIVQGIEAPSYAGDVAAARRAGDHAPDPYEDLTGRREMALDEPALKGGDSAMALLKAKAEELRKSNPSLSPEQAFAKVYSDPANRKLAQAERRKNRPVAA
jgi:hypothetical protein